MKKIINAMMALAIAFFGFFRYARKEYDELERASNGQGVKDAWSQERIEKWDHYMAEHAQWIKDEHDSRVRREDLLESESIERFTQKDFTTSGEILSDRKAQELRMIKEALGLEGITDPCDPLIERMQDSVYEFARSNGRLATRDDMHEIAICEINEVELNAREGKEARFSGTFDDWLYVMTKMKADEMGITAEELTKGYPSYK